MLLAVLFGFGLYVHDLVALDQALAGCNGCKAFQCKFH